MDYSLVLPGILNKFWRKSPVRPGAPALLKKSQEAVGSPGVCGQIPRFVWGSRRQSITKHNKTTKQSTNYVAKWFPIWLCNALYWIEIGHANCKCPMIYTIYHHLPHCLMATTVGMPGSIPRIAQPGVQSNLSKTVSWCGHSWSHLPLGLRTAEKTQQK
jgi:hypothetical protein